MRFKRLSGELAFWIIGPAIKFILRLSLRARMIVSAQDCILVVKPWLGNGKWILPGGGIKRGEEALAAAIREVKEETGVSVLPKDCRELGLRVYTSNGLANKYLLYSTNFSKPLKTVRQKGEIIEVAWINIQDINTDNSNSDVLDALNL